MTTSEDIESYIAGRNWSAIPPHMRGGVERYLRNGIPGGSFLMAVLENNLVRAFGAADEMNADAMREWAAFLHNEMPSWPIRSWGSQADVATWVASGGLVGQATLDEAKEKLPGQFSGDV